MWSKFPSNHIHGPSRDIFPLILIIQGTFCRWWSFIQASVVSVHEIFLILLRPTCPDQCLIHFQSFLLHSKYLIISSILHSLGVLQMTLKYCSPHQLPLSRYLRLGGYIPLALIITIKITLHVLCHLPNAFMSVILFDLYNIPVTYILLPSPILWVINLQHREI